MINNKITYEQLKSLSDELKKQYIQSDEVKKEFFHRFLPSISENEIEDYIVIMSESYIDTYPKMKEIIDLDWLFFSKYCDKPVAFKKEKYYIPQYKEDRKEIYENV